jgi:hypothetical protein
MSRKIFITPENILTTDIKLESGYCRPFPTGQEKIGG